MTRTSSLGWGLIGTSAIAADHMINAIRSNADSHVVSVRSSSMERAKSFASEQSIPKAFDSVDELLADDEIGAVYISTTNEQHKAQTIAAAKAGKHVLCEKPLALTVADAHAMARACADANVQFGVNHYLRNSSVFQTMHKMLADGAIGKPLAARVFHAVYLPEFLQTWRLDKPEAGGGVIPDITVHDTDTLRFVLQDEVEEVTAFSAQQGLSKQVEDAVMGVMRFRGGLIAQFHDAFTIKFAGTGFQVHGTDGSLIATNCMGHSPTESLILCNEQGNAEIDLGDQSNIYGRVIRQFNHAVFGHGQPTATGDDGLRSLAVAQAVRQSTKTGAKVAVQYE